MSTQRYQGHVNLFGFYPDYFAKFAHNLILTRLFLFPLSPNQMKPKGQVGCKYMAHIKPFLKILSI